MRAGERNQLITLNAPLITNDSGEMVKTYPVDSPPDQVWAKIVPVPLKRSETFETPQVRARLYVRACILPRDDVENDWRFTWGAQNFNITEVDRTGVFKGELWLTGECTDAQ